MSGIVTGETGTKLTKVERATERAIVALLQHPTIASAAESCGVSERTMWRWLQRDAFQKRFQEAQHAVVSSAVGALQAATIEAVKTLRRNLNCGNFFAENAAARTILEQAMRGVRMDEIEREQAWDLSVVSDDDLLTMARVQEQLEAQRKPRFALQRR